MKLIKLLLGAPLLLASFLGYGQFVQIPDDNFRTFLKEKYPACWNASDQLDTTCLAVVNETTLNANNRSIESLEGIQYFDKLEQLYCHFNNLSLLPKLPSGLKNLTCARNRLQALPALPIGLVDLWCSSNQLTALPTLPATLKSLDCYTNKIKILPALPNGLESMKCYSNQLKTLPGLPSSLIVLDASSNCFPTPPANPYPSTLATFVVGPNRTDCESLNLVSIPDAKFRTFLKANYAACFTGDMLDTTCGSLERAWSLNLAYKNIVNLDGVQYFDGLELLDCSYNVLTTLPKLPKGLINLNCEGNALKKLPALPNTLVTLNCTDNALTELPTLPIGLYQLFGSKNCYVATPQRPNTESISTFEVLPRSNFCSNPFVAIRDPQLRAALKAKFPNSFNSSDLMDISQAEVKEATQLVISGLNITDLDGLQYFTGLTILDCSENALKKLMALPETLKELYCHHNQLMALPSLPAGLKKLNISNNLLMGELALPNGLTHLTCHHNQLAGFPTGIPATLVQFSAANNCFAEWIKNPNPTTLVDFAWLPNNRTCGAASYAIKITDTSYVAAYEVASGQKDWGINLLEARCGFGTSIAELINIQEFHDDFVKFKDYPNASVQYGVIKGHVSSDPVYYHTTPYFQGDTIRKPVVKPIEIKVETRLQGADLDAFTWIGTRFFYVKDNAAPSEAAAMSLEVANVERKVDESYKSPFVDSLLGFFPRTYKLTSVLQHKKEQVLSDMRFYYKDTVFTFGNASALCALTITKSDSKKRQLVFIDPRVDSLVVKLAPGSEKQLTKLKLVYRHSTTRESNSKGQYRTIDSTTNFEKPRIVLRYQPIGAPLIYQPGDSVHYQFIAEFDTLQKPISFKADTILFCHSSFRNVSYFNGNSFQTLNYGPISQTTFQTKTLTFCGNYKPSSKITGDSMTCVGVSKTYSAGSATDKSLTYVWKYNTSQSTSPSFRVNFTSAATRNVEVTLSSQCGIVKGAKSITTLASPTKPSLTQSGAVLTSSAETGNQWYKDGAIIKNATYKTYTATSNGSYYVTASNFCGAATSNPVNVLSTGLEEKETKEVQLFPNPFHASLHLEGQDRYYKLELYDETGVKVMENSMFATLDWDLAKLPKGLYLLKLYDASMREVEARKIIKN